MPRKNVIVIIGIILVAASITAAQELQEKALPVGFVIASAGDKEAVTKSNSKWLLCDGKSLAIKDHLALFLVIGWTYGLGDDPKNRTSFSLPDYRGMFLRGVADGSNRDPDRDVRLEATDSSITAGDRVGTLQFDSLQSHKHLDAGHAHESDAAQGGWEWSDNAEDRKVGKPDAPTATIKDGFAKLGDPLDSQTGAGSVRHGKETRPVNIAVYWYIKSQ